MTVQFVFAFTVTVELVALALTLSVPPLLVMAADGSDLFRLSTPASTFSAP